MSARQCNGCTLCCKLIPADLPSGKKLAGERCPHQRANKGCAIYAYRPLPCAMWNCRWLINADTADLRRPDRSHYVIDIVPDFITLIEDDDKAKSIKIEVVQIWVDPDFRDAYKDPALLAYLARRGEQNVAAIIRYSSSEGFVMFPPSMTSSGTFIEKDHGMVRQRDMRERLAGLAEARGQ